MTLLIALLLCQQQRDPAADGPLEPGVVREEKPARPQEQDPADPQDPFERLTKVTNWQLEWAPSTTLYPNYIADPLTPRSGTFVMMPIKKGDNYKIETAVGSQRLFFRKWDEALQEGFDFGVDGAIISRMDLSEEFDLDAGDYMYGFPLTYRLGRISAKFRPWHLSSHLGDEYIRREGYSAIRYHKNELEVGFAYDWTPEFRTYVDGGWGFYVGTPNKPWRAQMGAEWVGNIYWIGPPMTFIALDIKWRQETDWDTAVSLQTGFYLFSGEKRGGLGLRFYLGYYFGHAAQTQFPEERNHFWGYGFAASF